MATTLTFEGFLSAVAPPYRPFVQSLHGELLAEGYRLKLEEKAAGPFLSFAHPKTKRSLLNLLFRKSGMMARLYADGLAQYGELVSSLPPTMAQEVMKGGDCKRLLDPTACNPKCPLGYAFTIGDKQFQKCRYTCFQFAVNDLSLPRIASLIEGERVARRGQG